MLKELEARFEHVEVIAPIARPLLIRVWLECIAVFHRAVFNKEYDKLRSSILSRYYAQVINKRLKKSRVDVIFAPAASTEIAFIKTVIPICYYSDSSFAQISDYYEEYKVFSERSKRESNQIEKKAIQVATACVYSSAWAADFVSDYYQKSRIEIFIAKFGANMVPHREMNQLAKKRSSGFNILFLGVDWHRKGGAKAVTVYNFLKEKGYPVSLTICGCNPDLEDRDITIIPFLDKNNEADREALHYIMMQTHLMLLPTEADCTPIVLNEAAAFGIPVIATHTGGISSQVEHGVNGFLAHSINDFLDYSEFLIRDPMRYEEMSTSALKKYENELSWEKWGDKITSIIQMLADPSL